jgi:hypothetical protein
MYKLQEIERNSNNRFNPLRSRVRPVQRDNLKRLKGGENVEVAERTLEPTLQLGGKTGGSVRQMRKEMTLEEKLDQIEHGYNEMESMYLDAITKIQAERRRLFEIRDRILALADKSEPSGKGNAKEDFGTWGQRIIREMEATFNVKQ